MGRRVFAAAVAAVLASCGGGTRSNPAGPGGATGAGAPSGTAGPSGPSGPSGPGGDAGSSATAGSSGGADPGGTASGGTSGGPAGGGASAGGTSGGDASGGGSSGGSAGGGGSGAQGTPTPSPGSGTVRWSAEAPGVFWVSMDDSGARWSAQAARASSTSLDDGVLRLQKRDRDGHLLWTGEWTYTGTYRFTAAVTPQGEALFSATPGCSPGDTACSPSITVGGAVRADATVKLRADGSVRWVRPGGELVGADVEGGSGLLARRSDGTWAIFKLDADGNEVWSKDVTSIAAYALDRTGDLLVTGCYQGDALLLPGIPCTNGMVATRLDHAGASLWTAHADGYWAVIGSAADGSEVAAARGSPFDLTAISPDGAVRWSRTFGSGLFGNQRGDALLVAVAADGPAAIAGYADRYAYGPPAVDGPLTYGVVTGFDAGGSPTFVLKLTTLPPPVSMVYGRDRELVLAVPAGTVYGPSGAVGTTPAEIVDLVP